MKRYAIILLALCLLWPAGADAQRRKRNAKKPAKPVVVEDPRIQQMLSSTQKVVFIDSIVANKKDFLRHIPLSKDAGYLEQNDSLGQFTNELKDHRLTTYFNKKDSACHISQSDYIGNKWTAPQPLEGISSASAMRTDWARRSRASVSSPRVAAIRITRPQPERCRRRSSPRGRKEVPARDPSPVRENRRQAARGRAAERSCASHRSRSRESTESGSPRTPRYRRASSREIRVSLASMNILPAWFLKARRKYTIFRPVLIRRNRRETIPRREIPPPASPARLPERCGGAALCDIMRGKPPPGHPPGDGTAEGGS